jgi:oxygen-independent coproporphyrinogen-3 oxidase
VSSFGHVNGVHYQNASGWQPWHDAIDRGELPIERAYVPTDDERLTREFILQLKLGRVAPSYFRDKFGVDPRERFGAALDRLAEQGFLDSTGDEIRLSRAGLLRVDSLLPFFYDERYRHARYT